jgi:outer membrane receptor protein involved in Fe transport
MHRLSSADATYVLPSRGGQHTFQAGTQYKPRSRGQSDSNYPANGPALVDEVRRVMPDGSVVYTPFHRRIQSPSNVTAFSNTYELLGFYVQDKWRATDRLSVTLGARYDIQKTADTFDLWGIETGSFNPASVRRTR